jgi:hypothetical protein
MFTGPMFIERAYFLSLYQSNLNKPHFLYRLYIYMYMCLYSKYSWDFVVSLVNNALLHFEAKHTIAIGSFRQWYQQRR